MTTRRSNESDRDWAEQMDDADYQLAMGIEPTPRKPRCLSGHESRQMKNDEWLTPPEIIKALGKFDLDPCSPEKRPWPTAATHFTKSQDGLLLPWHGRVWLNPPFGDEAVKWMEKMAAHGDGTALIPARTETNMFHRYVWKGARGIFFLKGRPHFHYVDGRRAKFGTGAPMCLIGFGFDDCEALIESGLTGTFVWI